MSSRSGRDYEHFEDDLHARASGRNSRPRSKRRPTHEHAVAARVTTVDRGRYTCRVEDVDGRTGPEVTAVRAREMRRGGVVVGDRVGLVGDVSGETGTLARLVRVEPRSTTLRRTADDTDPVERVIVANADVLGIVTAATDPQPRPRLIDRCIVAAYDGGLAPLLVVTKTDLAPPDDLLTTYSALDVPVVAIRRDQSPDGLHDMLHGHRSVLVGPSGVGKSTLVNALVPDAERAVGGVNPVTGRGRHTSSSAIALALPDGGWVIDTPGVRSFGLAHVDLDRVLRSFPDLAAGADACPRGCDHLNDSCALDAWVGAGQANTPRLDSLRRLLAARDEADDGF
ncbi:MAG: ribosome small subunit-dependent GTPase A [Jiangellales bacterium]